MVYGINGNNGSETLSLLNALRGTKQTGSTSGTTNVGVNKTIDLQGTNTTQRTDLSSTIDHISNKAKVNSPEAQGLASAADIEQGKLVSGYTFDDINSLGGAFDTKLFGIKYTNTDATRVAQGTKYASECFEYAEVASHLQDKNSPFAELFVS